MTSRPLMIAAALGASIGVPYVMSHKPASPGAAPPAAASAPSTVSSWLPWSTTGPTATVTGVSTARGAPAVGQPPLLPTSPVADTVRLHPVETVLRFDLTRDWVYSSWERKSTGPTDVGLLAVRVALVSGTDISSIAGSLTYFFNDRGGIEHISFRGRTGDSRRLVEFLTRTYHFAPVASPTGEQVYQVASGDKVQSELRIHPESVILSSSPRASVVVELELARPGSTRSLPPRAPALQIPQTAGAPPPQAAAGKTTAADAESSITSSVKSYFDQSRYATPQEESQLQRMRWPN